VNVFVLISKRHFFWTKFAIYIARFQWVQIKMINFTH